MTEIPQVPPFGNDVLVTFENLDPMHVRRVVNAVQALGYEHSISVESKRREFDDGSVEQDAIVKTVPDEPRYRRPQVVTDHEQGCLVNYAGHYGDCVDKRG